MGEPTFSIIIPSMGDHELEDTLLDSLLRTASRPYQVCLGFDPSGTNRVNFSVDTVIGRIDRVIAKAPGMSAAVNAAFSRATGEWIIWVCDDMVFLPGWDDFPPLRKDRMLCFDLLEPLQQTSFPPAVWAGDWPSKFDERTAEAAASRRLRERTNHTSPGWPFGTMLFHRSVWAPWPTWCDPFTCNDISWFHEMRLANPDLAFGRIHGNCLYHFVRGSVRSRLHLTPDGQKTWDAFLARYGLTIQDAYNTIDTGSRRLWPLQEQ